jgi:phenylacetate-coenzyme A ligase PaaK-like adenylate-forming protein
MLHTGQRILNIKSAGEFNALALDVFRLQAAENRVYGRYLSLLGIRPETVSTVEEIPFLPIGLFKSEKIITGNREPELVFRSSGTTGQQPSVHYVASAGLYRESALNAFTRFYENPQDICILALLPSYLEREDSSLVYMMNHLVTLSRHPDSGFYLNNYAELANKLKQRTADGTPTLLLGVSFALLDLAEQHPVGLSENITIMETGGMKGRRKEMVREELHHALQTAFNVRTVHSEYGMTELLSQAYSTGSGKFNSPPWMKVLVRDLYDPFTLLPAGRSGGINIIDLANLYSCSFIATEDTGKVMEDGSFEITGRSDHSEVRGCNLMVV